MQSRIKSSANLIRSRQSKLRIAAIAAVGAIAFFYADFHRRYQAAGVCSETGQTLSETEILELAQTFAIESAVANGAKVSTPELIHVRLVPETSLRPEYAVPDWVRNAGGFRTYIEIQFNDRTTTEIKGSLMNHSGIWVVSNCGAIRSAVYEFSGSWLW